MALASAIKGHGISISHQRPGKSVIIIVWGTLTVAPFIAHTHILVQALVQGKRQNEYDGSRQLNMMDDSQLWLTKCYI